MSFFSRIILAGCFALAAGAAKAELQVCNDSDDIQFVSVGYKGDSDWTSEGWWSIDPGKCVTPVGGDLKKRYYYLRAEVNGGDFKGGDYFFCTTPEEYTIVGDTDCVDRGYDSEDFIEIDTGETAKSHVYRLTQADMERAQSGSAESDLGLTFCNETEFVQAISVGYKGDEGFTSEGWWNADPGECVTPISGALKTRYYYYRAEVDGGDFDGENYYFCTTPEAYTIVGDENCDGRGYDRESFREIDTGETSKEFTYTLVSGFDDSNDSGKPGSGKPDGGTDFGSNSGSDSGSDLGLEFCNQTANTQSVSVGYEGDEGWTSEGWWNVDPGKCSNTLSGALQKQYYYYRTEVKGTEFIGGSYTFCTTPEAYTIVGDTDCEARGYDKETFAEINIGVGSNAHTVTLLPPEGSTPAGDDDRALDETAIDNIVVTGAGLEMCNQTSSPQEISIGYEGDEGWTSEGWWVAEPGECVTPAVDGKPHRYFYYRAEISGGPFTGQNYFFCTSPDAYTIVGDENCEGRGYDREDFYEIDTGGLEGMFAFTLVDPEELPDAGNGKNTGVNDAPVAPPMQVPAPGTAPKSGGIDFERNEPTSTPEPAPAPAPAPVPEPEPEPEVIPEPEPEPEVIPLPVPEPPKPPRRGGSRGG